MNPSVRAQIVTRRTYNRPLDDAGTVFETWEQTVDRVIDHQAWLWRRAKGSALGAAENGELRELRQLMLDRKVSLSGRTLWLGGTDIAKYREASQFNCSFSRVQTVYDVVDGFWLLLQGCGVGFEPVPGVLSGFAKPVEIEVKRSLNKTRGYESNWQSEDVTEDGLRVITITVGDSAESWAKAAGKLLALKRPFDKIVLDFSEVRRGGQRLRGYGWISSGDETIHKAFFEIAQILNRRAGKLLTRIDILDVMNWLGTTLSSRRSAEIALVPWGDPEAEAFATAKKEFWVENPQRAQSNNTIMFTEKPGPNELGHIFGLMMEAGGSEPGFYNAAHAKRRAPWFKGTNPCGEILLGDKSFCNLVEVDVAKFNGDFSGLKMAIWIVARANYRQTCVQLKDGVLSDSWHELNEYLRLCGVGLTGIVRWEYSKDAEAYQQLRLAAHLGAESMADELGLPRSKAVTTIKPSGTLSKIMDTTEGAHKPLGKYIFNNINFSIHDPLVPVLQNAGYRTMPNPFDPTSILVTIPVAWEDVEFDQIEKNGEILEVNLESAVDQLERYKLLMDNYVDHNCSITVSYDPSEVPEIVKWLSENWDHYVGVSFLYRTDPTKTAADLGYLYLPQEVVTKRQYDEYVSTLKPIDLSGVAGEDLVDDACAVGACPVR